MPAAPNAPLRLIHGEDDLSVAERARAQHDAWCRELGGMDHEIIDAAVGNSGDALKALGKLREALQTLPFFGGGKAVWFKGCNFLADDRTSASAAVTESLAELAAELKTFQWGTVRLLISAGKVDKRKTFYKTIEKTGAVEEHKGLSLDDKDWEHVAAQRVRQEFEARGQEAAYDAVNEVVQSVGPNLRQIVHEVEKISLFAGERPRVTVADVEAVVIRNKNARAFALADALGERNLPKALHTLDEEMWSMHLDKNKSEIGLLYGLISKVRLMLVLREMVREGWIQPGAEGNALKAQFERIPPGQLPEDRKFNPATLHPFAAARALAQSQNFTTAELVRAMAVLLETNMKLVTSRADERLTLQQALVQILSGPKPAPAKPGASRR